MNEDDDECGYPIEESTFDIDANDPNMQQKITKNQSAQNRQLPQEKKHQRDVNF